MYIFEEHLTMEIEENSIKYIDLKIISSKKKIQKTNKQNTKSHADDNWLEKIKILNEQPIKQLYSKLVCSLFPTSNERCVKCSN